MLYVGAHGSLRHCGKAGLCILVLEYKVQFSYVQNKDQKKDATFEWRKSWPRWSKSCFLGGFQGVQTSATNAQIQTKSHNQMEVDAFSHKATHKPKT